MAAFGKPTQGGFDAMGKPMQMGATATTSRMQGTAVGGGSRPGKTGIEIKTSAPIDPHTLNRAPPGWLK